MVHEDFIFGTRYLTGAKLFTMNFGGLRATLIFALIHLMMYDVAGHAHASVILAIVRVA